MFSGAGQKPIEYRIDITPRESQNLRNAGLLLTSSGPEERRVADLDVS